MGQVEVAAEEAAEIVEHHAHVGDRAGRTGDQIDGMAPVAVQLTARRVDEVVGDGSRRPVRDPAHRVGDVTVEAREEPEPVFAGQVLAAVLAGLRHREASRLTAGDRQQLVDLDVEAALDQLVGGAEPGDAAAEDDDFRSHFLLGPQAALRFQFEGVNRRVLRVFDAQHELLVDPKQRTLHRRRGGGTGLAVASR